MFTDRFLRQRRGAKLSTAERGRLETAISEVRSIAARKTIARTGETLAHSTLLIDGIMSRYLDDSRGLRQLVAIHLPGDFLDLHGFPLHSLDHDVASLTHATVAIVPHAQLEAIAEDMPGLTRKLWYATLLDAAIHRAWLFRLGRLDALGRVAHFLCETSARLFAAGLGDGGRFALALTQSDIGEICGLTTVHVNRVIRQLREERLCIFRSSLVEILDPSALATRGEFDPAYLYIEDSDNILPTTKRLRR